MTTWVLWVKKFVRSRLFLFLSLFHRDIFHSVKHLSFFFFFFFFENDFQISASTFRYQGHGTQGARLNLLLFTSRDQYFCSEAGKEALVEVQNDYDTQNCRIRSPPEPEDLH